MPVLCLKPHPVLHLRLLDQRWVTRLSPPQSLKVCGEKAVMKGLGSTSQQCLLQVGIHTQTHSPQPPDMGTAKPEMASFEQSFN